MIPLLASNIRTVVALKSLISKDVYGNFDSLYAKQFSSGLFRCSKKNLTISKKTSSNILRFRHHPFQNPQKTSRIPNVFAQGVQVSGPSPAKLPGDIGRRSPAPDPSAPGGAGGSRIIKSSATNQPRYPRVI
jgi:hypothetical protein